LTTENTTMTDLTMSQFASKDDLLAAQAARIAELESQLEAIGAGGVEPLRKQVAAPQAVQPAVPDGWQMVPAKPTEAMVGAIMSEGEVDAVAGLAPELRPILLERAGIAARYTAMLAAAPAHPAEGVPAQASEWDGKLPERLQSVLNALRLELPAAVVNDVEFEVRSHYEAMHTSISTLRRMYGAARDRLEAIDAAQPDPFAATQPAAQGMDALGAHGHQERSA
jgi:hypothetical protein